jgi:hypothetical protein
MRAPASNSACCGSPRVSHSNAESGLGCALQAAERSRSEIGITPYCFLFWRTAQDYSIVPACAVQQSTEA